MKFKKIFRCVSLFLIIIGFGMLFSSKSHDIMISEGKEPVNPGEDEKIILKYRDESSLDYVDGNLMEEIELFDTPEYFQYNKNYASEERTKYGEQRFYETKYLDSYAVYTQKSPYDRNTFLSTSSTIDYSYLRPNHQIKFGGGGKYLASPTYSYNLKKGSTPPNDATGKNYSGDNKGNMQVQDGPYKGKMYEWRYMFRF